MTAGALFLMTSAAFAVALGNRGTRCYWGMTLLFVYTTVATVFERPEGVRIVSLFMAGIVGGSLVSRAFRPTEPRSHAVLLDETARRLWKRTPPRACGSSHTGPRGRRK